jgi:molybdopterin-guanine dinucleotide biosynthesis protein A
VTVTAIVLAGGRSRRFGADKLVAQLDGTTVLAATIEAVAGVADRVVVAGPSIPDQLGARGLAITVAPDAEADGGPLVALAGVLASLPFAPTPGPHDTALVVGGDMPRLVPAVLLRMLDVLDVDPAIDGVYLAGPGAPEGAEAPTGTTLDEPARRQVLPLAIRAQPASRAAREAVQAGRRSLQDLVDSIAAIELPATAWLPLDPDALTLTDVDTRADLDRLNAP